MTLPPRLEPLLKQFDDARNRLITRLQGSYKKPSSRLFVRKLCFRGEVAFGEWVREGVK